LSQFLAIEPLCEIIQGGGFGNYAIDYIHNSGKYNCLYGGCQ
jgi:hypothetical protein